MTDALSPSLVADVLRGDPAAAAELHRLQESEVRGRFSGPREGFLGRVMGRALLGRSRSPSTALTREEERLLEQTRPDLRYSSAAASPEKTYPGSRLATTPALAALPAAGVAAGAGYLATLPTDLPSWAKSLITAGSAGLGGVAGSTAAHVMRQRHARALRREERKEASSVEELVPYATDALEKSAGIGSWFKGLLRGGADDAASAVSRTTHSFSDPAAVAARVHAEAPTLVATMPGGMYGPSHSVSVGRAAFPPPAPAPVFPRQVNVPDVPLGKGFQDPTVGVPMPYPLAVPAARAPVGASVREFPSPSFMTPEQGTVLDFAETFAKLREAPLGFRETLGRMRRGMPLLPMDQHNIKWMGDVNSTLSQHVVRKNALSAGSPFIGPADLAETQARALGLGVGGLLPKAEAFTRELGQKLSGAFTVDALVPYATDALSKLAEDASDLPSAMEPEDVRRMRRLRAFLSRMFHRSRSAKTVSVAKDVFDDVI